LVLSPSAMKIISPLGAITDRRPPFERIARLIVAGDALAAERHQQLAVGAELEDWLVAAVG